MSWADIIARANADAPRPRAKRATRSPEHALQCACVRWFRLQHPRLARRLVAVANGGLRTAATGARLRAEGVTPGVSDLVLFASRGPYGALLIEMKTDSPSSRQSPAQKEWQADLTADGEYLYVVCRSLDQFISQTEDYLALGPHTTKQQ